MKKNIRKALLEAGGIGCVAACLFVVGLYLSPALKAWRVKSFEQDYKAFWLTSARFEKNLEWGALSSTRTLARLSGLDGSLQAKWYMPLSENCKQRCLEREQAEKDGDLYYYETKGIDPVCGYLAIGKFGEIRHDFKVSKWPSPIEHLEKLVSSSHDPK